MSKQYHDQKNLVFFLFLNLTDYKRKTFEGKTEIFYGGLAQLFRKLV